MNGYVYLVGAGPGDEGLECLKRADIVLYDRLLNPFFLSYTKQTCELMYWKNAKESYYATRND